MPYEEEARHQLTKRLADDPSLELLSHGATSDGTSTLKSSPSPLPDALYMLSPDRSPATLLADEDRWGSPSTSEGLWRIISQLLVF